MSSKDLEKAKSEKDLEKAKLQGGLFNDYNKGYNQGKQDATKELLNLNKSSHKAIWDMGYKQAIKDFNQVDEKGRCKVCGLSNCKNNPCEIFSDKGYEGMTADEIYLKGKEEAIKEAFINNNLGFEQGYNQRTKEIEDVLDKWCFKDCYNEVCQKDVLKQLGIKQSLKIGENK